MQAEEDNVETIRSCLNVLVEQTRSSHQFWDSLKFLNSNRSLQTEFLERLIKKEQSESGQRTQSATASATTLTRDASLDQKYFTPDSYRGSNINDNSLLIEHNPVTIRGDELVSLLDMALVQLALINGDQTLDTSAFTQQANVAVYMINRVMNPLRPQL